MKLVSLKPASVQTPIGTLSLYWATRMGGILYLDMNLTMYGSIRIDCQHEKYTIVKASLGKNRNMWALCSGSSPPVWSD